MQQTAAEADGKTVVVVGWDGAARGLLVVADTIKESSAEAVRQMRELGLRPVLLTGDNESTARAVAAAVGIDEVYAGVLPQDKVDVVTRLQADGRRVVMVGDGVNDAAALAQSDLGLAMGTGTDAAIEAADLTLVRGDLRSVVDAIRLSRRTFGTIKGNLFWAFAYNVAALPAGRGRSAQPDARRRRHGVLVGVRRVQQPATAPFPFDQPGGDRMSHDHHDMSSTGRALTMSAISATLHCLTGCAIGEVLGMVIGTAARPEQRHDDRAVDRAGLLLRLLA